MKIYTAYKFDRSELKHLDVFPPDRYDPAAHGNEPWVDAFIYAAYNANNRELQVCVNGNSTTSGDPCGISILVLTEDLPAWRSSAQLIGVKIEEAIAPLKGGIFGDKENQIDLAQCDETFYWIDEILNPAAAVVKNGGSSRRTLVSKDGAENGGTPTRQC